MEVKTGAIICRKTIEGTRELEYEALLFIADVPLDISDADLYLLLDKKVLLKLSVNCADVIIRADIAGTSNEVQEQFAGLNNDTGKARMISFNVLQ